MKEQLHVNVPKAFLHPLFYKENDKIILESNSDHTYLNPRSTPPFLFDILSLQELELYKPWLDRKTTVPLLIEEWNADKPIVKELFGNRKKAEATPLMIKGIAILIMAIHWTNKKPVPSLIDWKEHVDSLLYKPVNCVERLDYVINSPGHYHSYIQMVELFEELLKQFHLSLLKEKKQP